MRIVTESDQCVSEEEPVNTRVSVPNFSLEGKSIHLEPRVREDPHKKNHKSSSPQQLTIDLQREQGIQLPKKPARAKKTKRRLSDQRKSVREVVLTRRPSAVPRTLIPPRTPLVMSKMSMPTEGQKFTDERSEVNASEEASNVVKRLMGTNAVVEESTTKKVTKQTAVKGNVSSIRGQVLQQQNSLENVTESNNNRALSEINSNNQMMNTSQKTVSSTSSTMSSKTTRRESYSTQTQVQESFSSSYEDCEDNSGVAAICSPDQIKAAKNVSKTSKTSKQVKEVKQSTLQSTSSFDSDISSVQKTKDTEKITAENVDYTEQTKTMSVEEFQKIRTIKEFIHIQKKLKNAEDNDTEEEEEEDYESEKIMSVDDIRKKLSANPPKEVINDATKNQQIVKGSRIEEIRTTTKTIYPNPDNGDQPVEQLTVTVERKVVPAGTTIMSNTENTENTKKMVVATQETAVKKTSKTESQQVKQTKTSGTQEVVQQDTAVQNVQNTQNVNKQNVQNVQAVQTVQQTENVQNVQQVQQNVQNVQTQNVQQVQQNVQTQNVQQVQQNTQKVVETQNVQQKVQDVQTQNVQQNTQNVQQNTQNVQSQNVQQNTQNVQTQNVQQNTQNVNTQQTTTQNTDKSQQTQAMTLEEFQNIRKIKEYITTERKMMNPEDNFVEEEGETSFEAEIIMTLEDIRKRIATQPPKETVKDTTKNAPIPPGSKILEIRTITRTVLPNPDKNDEKVEQVTVLLERTVVPAGTPLIPNAENIPQKKVITAGQETAVKKTTSTESQQVQQTKTQDTQTGSTDTQNVAQNQNVQNTQNIQNTQNTQNIQSTHNIQNTQNTLNQQNIQNTQQNVQNVQSTNIKSTNIQSTNIQESQRNLQESQNVQNTQNEALNKSSVNQIKKTTLTSTSSIDSDASSLDEASRLNQNTQLVDANQMVGGASVVKQTSSKTTKVTETRKIIKQSSTGAPETHVEEASKTQSSETVVNATCGSDGKFNVEENTKSSTMVSSGVGSEEEMKRKIQSQNKNLTKKLVSDGVTVVANVDQVREKLVQQQEGEKVTFKQTTTDSKHKRMVEDASKFEQPALALAALPSPDSQPGSASPQIEMPSLQRNK